MNKDNIFEKEEGYPEKSTRNVLNIKDVLSVYIHNWPIFLICIVLALGASWLYLRYTIPQYKVSATLLIRNDNSRGGAQMTDNTFSNLLMQSGSNKQNEIQILQSRSIMLRVVNKLGLTSQYYVKGNIKTTNIFNDSPFTVEILSLNNENVPVSFNVILERDNSVIVQYGKTEKISIVPGQPFHLPSGKFVIHLQSSSYSNSEYKEFVFNFTPDHIRAINLKNNLKVAPLNDQSNVLELTFVTDNPTMGAAILNTLMSEYNQAAIEDKNETNRLVLAFLDDRLRLVEKQLDSVETELQRYKTAQNVIDLPTQSGFYFDNLGELGSNLRDQEVQLNILLLLEQYVNDPANISKPIPTTLGISDRSVTSMIDEYNRLLLEKQDRLQKGATVNSPFLLSLEDNIKSARQKIIESMANVRQAYQSSISTLESKISRIRNQVSSIPEKEKKSKERIRQQEIKQNLYLFLLEKREESSISAASTISSARVVDKAIDLKVQVAPKATKTYAIAFAAGLLIPIIIIYVLGVFNDKVTTRDDITNVTPVPIVGEVGHNRSDRVLVFDNDSRSVVAEQIRILRSNLRFMLSDKKGPIVIMVTSSFSGEGKSFISTNLAGSLALSGLRTVILEFDLRKPKILEGLGISKRVGISNYLVGAANLDELPVQVADQENLFVIGCGLVPPNPAELILSKRVKTLFEWLRGNFEAIIIDTAPIGLVSDSVALSPYTDLALYVVRQRYTHKRQIQFIDEVYQQKKLPNMGLVVNDVVAKGAGGYYGYGGGYGYGYGYGYGHEGYISEAPKKGKLIAFWRKFRSRV